MFTVDVQIDQASWDRAKAWIDKAAQFGAPSSIRRDLFQRIGVAALEWIKENFRSGGARVGGWAPLRPLTVFARRGGSSVPLLNLGHMMDAFAVSPATESEVRVGIGGDLGRIALYHQLGTGPYVIPKEGNTSAKALAFPAPLGYFSPAGGSFLRNPGGLQGNVGGIFLRRRPKGTPRTGLVAASVVRAAGLQRPAGRGDVQAFAVFRRVRHPGLPARRMIPTAVEILPTVQAVIANWLAQRGGQ